MDTLHIRNTDPAGITYDIEGAENVAPGDVVELPAEIARKYLRVSHVWAPADPEAHTVAEDLANAMAAAQHSGEPPRGGPGSGADAWAAYAEIKGIKVPDDASRDDIIAAVDAANEEA